MAMYRLLISATLIPLVSLASTPAKAIEGELNQKLAATGILASFICQKERGVHTEETINTAFMMGVQRFKLDPDIFEDKKVIEAAVRYVEEFVNEDCTRKPDATNQKVTTFIKKIIKQ